MGRRKVDRADTHIQTQVATTAAAQKGGKRKRFHLVSSKGTFPCSSWRAGEAGGGEALSPTLPYPIRHLPYRDALLVPHFLLLAHGRVAWAGRAAAADAGAGGRYVCMGGWMGAWVNGLGALPHPPPARGSCFPAHPAPIGARARRRARGRRGTTMLQGHDQGWVGEWADVPG